MRFTKYVTRRQRIMLLAAVAASVASAAANAGLLAVLYSVIANFTARQQPAVIVLYALLAFSLPMFRFGSETLLAKLGQDVLLDIQLRLCGQITGVSLLRLEGIGTGRVFAALTEDVGLIANAAITLPTLWINAALLVCCLLYLTWVSAPMTLIVVLILAGGLAAHQWFLAKAMALFRRAREDGDILVSHYRGLTDGMKELKMHSRRRLALLRVIEGTARSARRYNISAMAVYSAVSSCGQAIVFVAIALFLFVLPGIFEIGSDLVLRYSVTMLYMMTPIQVLTSAAPAVGRAGIALSRIEALGLSLQEDQSERAAASEKETHPAGWKSLTLHKVVHTYIDRDECACFALGPLDLSFHPGELVFLVGGNGSGKTTLAKVLLGLYHPERGEILLDGTPVTNENRDAYRQIFSVVFADFFLFASLLGVDATDVDANRHLETLQLSHKVHVRDGCLSSTDLSQGQRRRLALLMAYLEDRPIYVFDEWAADQDPAFKQLFYRTLVPELRARNKTIFVITHDERYFDVASRIVRLEEGQVISDSSNESTGLSQPLHPAAFGQATAAGTAE